MKIHTGYKVKVKEGEYTDRPETSRYNLPRGIGTVVRGSSHEGFLVINYPIWGDSPPVNPNSFEKVIIVEPCFEVGKKYLFETGKMRIYECVWADAKTSSAMFTYEQDGKHWGVSITHEYRTKYIEYIEPPKPRTISVWFNVYQSAVDSSKLECGLCHSSKEEAVKCAKGAEDRLIETVEYTYTEKL